jgi:hypothetical protein
MKIRFEVGLTKSSAWPFFLRLAKKQKGYKVEYDEGLEVHIIETEDPEAALAINSKTWAWKNVDYYLDGRLVSKTRMSRILWDIEERGSRVGRMLNRIIERKQNERDDGFGLR